MIDLIILAVWLMLPAYIANPAAALLGGGRPIDMGKNFTDNKRILGDGKTIRGFVLGSFCGTMVGILQILLAPSIAPYLQGYVSEGMLTHASYVALLTMPVGALLGDMVKSFFKRRLGFERGAMMPVADQLDFVLGAWVLTYFLDGAWFTANFSPAIILTVLLITPVLHMATNFIGFKIGRKDVPW
ncbi:CDP-2,3-bis-(O-geranylgeranyl)-sn-glycerol synthase [Methanocella conradii]|uniref:CDP-2,3-bis-(O-geranylgeranyl)-sn-glycerol synthase n=1 Tax=Methanocella conradii TaxID=1175444 RepID=UPI00157CF811|nr:CDP-2,3-bis-(O-geranylgeranyl)-sn-glycerol synthase [Methanocella conradii]